VDASHPYMMRFQEIPGGWTGSHVEATNGRYRIVPFINILTRTRVPSPLKVAF